MRRCSGQQTPRSARCEQWGRLGCWGSQHGGTFCCCCYALVRSRQLAPLLLPCACLPQAAKLEKQLAELQADHQRLQEAHDKVRRE